MSDPFLICVAPNGARKQKSDHAALPLSATELADEAAACMQAGAGMIYLHVRDEEGGHALDADRYLEASQAVRDATDGQMLIQITTEAVGLYQPEQQIDCVKAVKPEAVSLALRELVPHPDYEEDFADFMRWLEAEQILPQFILYSEADIQLFKKLKCKKILSDHNHSVLFVLGRYAADQQSSPCDLDEFIPFLADTPVWSVCAFGAKEQDCLLRGRCLGGHARVGFENNMLLSDGTLAANNAALVKQLAEAVQQEGGLLMTGPQARDFFAQAAGYTPAS